MSQATLTRQMQSLESDIGDPLLARGHSGVALTAAGHLLLEVFSPADQSANS